MSIAGFGSLLSIDSARFTFPDLQNFRTRKVRPHVVDAAAKAQTFAFECGSDLHVQQAGCSRDRVRSLRSAAEIAVNRHGANVLQVDGFRRVFAHTAPVFFERGIAKLNTLEISSLSCEEAPGHSIVVSVFDVPYNPEMVAVGHGHAPVSQTRVCKPL